MSTHGTAASLVWRKARSSGNTGCLELAPLPDGGVAVRDSKQVGGPVLRYTAHEWSCFLDAAKKGEFDRLA